jgi:DNA polymerase-3 subunit delta
LLYGDSYLVPRALARLEEAEETGDLFESNRHRLQGGQIELAELTNVCFALPFMDGKRLVLVEGLLDSFEGRRTEGRRTGRGRQRGGGSASASLGGWEGLAASIPEMPETTVLVFTDGNLANGNTLLKALTPVAQAQPLPTPNGERLARWVKSSVEEKGGNISPTAIRSLTDMVGQDLWAMDREIEKLCLYTRGQRIEEQHVTEMVHQAREASIFTAVDAMIDGRQRVALELLQQLRQDGRDASYVVAMVERQLRLLALARNAMDEGVRQNDLGRRIGVTNDFVLRKTVDQARRHTFADISYRYERLLEADLAIKTGRMEPDLALELLAADQPGS